ncbi:hypothetical protein HanIR_Chr11g0508941 [Helianthus annuus]|nr:hypothetical protein HanIR_Chr11g0508941 [Helianthus annuus]
MFRCCPVCQCLSSLTVCQCLLVHDRSSHSCFTSYFMLSFINQQLKSHFFHTILNLIDKKQLHIT